MSNLFPALKNNNNKNNSIRVPIPGLPEEVLTKRQPEPAPPYPSPREREAPVKALHSLFTLPC